VPRDDDQVLWVAVTFAEDCRPHIIVYVYVIIPRCDIRPLVAGRRMGARETLLCIGSAGSALTYAASQRPRCSMPAPLGGTRRGEGG